VIAACEQCGRNKVPEVQPLLSVADYRPAGTGMKILLSPQSRQPLSRLSFDGSEMVIAAGPEAGFTDEEEATLVKAGFTPASLGPRVLRTETAAVAALAALNALRGDF
jgi:16S rRNA (uracil1498-N3)-methyltransferase